MSQPFTLSVHYYLISNDLGGVWSAEGVFDLDSPDFRAFISGEQQQSNALFTLADVSAKKSFVGPFCRAM